MCKILSRIQEIASNERITIGAMERTIGASKGVLSRAIANGTDIQSKWLMSIVENYPQYSGSWLLTGEGPMLKELHDFPASLASISNRTMGQDNDETIAQIINDSNERHPGSIPLVSEKAVGGFANEHFSIKETDVLAYYVIPKFRHLGVDFMIEIVGDSMIPKFYPGDIIACSIIDHSRYIEWNKCHLIATVDRGLIVKRLMPGSDDSCLKVMSDNKDYPPFDIPKDEIAGMARVVGVIHLE